MKKHLTILSALALTLALPGCFAGTSAPPASPAAIASNTVLDEKLAVGAELAYKAARQAVELAVDAGLIRGPQAAKVAQIDNQAYRAVQGVRAAYRAGNATSYEAAYAEALGLIGDLVSLIK